MDPLRITIPAKEAQEVRRVARRRKQTPQAVVRAAVRSYTQDQDWEKAEQIGRRIAQRLGIRTEADVTRVFD